MSRSNLNVDHLDRSDADLDSYDAAVQALLSPLHQASTKEAIAITAARRTQTVSDMRRYWSRIQLKNKNEHGDGDGDGDTTFLPPTKRLIHITGTKGKGSTACLCQAILQAHGYSTGLFTSPHLMDIRERIRWNGLPIHPTLFAKAYWKVRRDLEAYNNVEDGNDDYDGDDGALPALPGYFRMLTLMAYYTFATLQVDVWIIEVGMGGRYDATNFWNRPTQQQQQQQDNVACGVTLLDLDHTRILGNTLEQIAWEKGGIFAVDKAATTHLTPNPKDEDAGETSALVPDSSNNNAPTFYILDSNTDSVIQVFRRCAINEGLGANLQPVDAKGDALRLALGRKPLGLAGQHQYGNATLAIQLCQSILGKELGDDLAAHPQTLAGLATAEWPARCQTVVRPPSFTFRLDGAHTPQSMAATMDWFSSKTGLTPRRVLIFNSSHERNPVELLELLQPANFTAVYFCKADSSRPSPIEPPSSQELLEAAGIPIRAEFGGNSGSGSFVTTQNKETWQDTLGIVWRHVDAAAKITSTQRVGGGGRRPPSTPGGRHTQHYATPVTCHLTVAQAVREVTTGTMEPTEILVTGSLYLVGSCLKTLRWTEDSSPDDSSLL